jgi:hypothetical protein
MHKIFICYRHAGAPHAAGRLGDNLREQFGEEQVFRDREDMRGGASWRQQVLHAISAQSALVVLIDREWGDPGQAVGRRRLDNPTDPIRMEIRDGLADGATIIPVLLDGAQMPDEAALPADIGALAGIHALPLRDTDWPTDFPRIARLLEQAGFRRASQPAPAPPPVTARPQPQPVARRGSPAKVVLACVGGGLGLLLLAAVASQQGPGPNPAPAPAVVVPPVVVPATMVPATPPAPAAAASTPMLAGAWKDTSDGSQVVFTQMGNLLRLTTTTEQGVTVEGTGAVLGQQVEVNLSVMGLPAGKLSLALSDDGQNLRGTVVDLQGQALPAAFSR